MERLKEKRKSRRRRARGGATVMNRCGYRGSFFSPNCSKKQRIVILCWIIHHDGLVGTIWPQSPCQTKNCFGTFLFSVLLVVQECLVPVNLCQFSSLWWEVNQQSTFFLATPPCLHHLCELQWRQNGTTECEVNLWNGSTYAACVLTHQCSMYERHRRKYSFCAKGETTVDVVLIKVGGCALLCKQYWLQITIKCWYGCYWRPNPTFDLLVWACLNHLRVMEAVIWAASSQVICVFVIL